VAGRPKLYVETTVISYLTAWPSSEMVTAAHQRITKDWWQAKRNEFDLFVSELVIRESMAGDRGAAQLRIETIHDLEVLSIDDETTRLAEMLAAELGLPERAAADSVHIAIAAVNGMDYLVTWNCRHIANARHRQRIEDICESLSYVAPIICTPEELIEDQ
jgi:hypothetical protein